MVRNTLDEDEDSFILQLKKRVREQVSNQMDEKNMTQSLQEKKIFDTRIGANFQIMNVELKKKIQEL